MYIVNVHRGSVVRRVRPSSCRPKLVPMLTPRVPDEQQAAPVPILHLRRSTQLVASTVTGSLALLDTRTSELTVQESVLADRKSVV